MSTKKQTQMKAEQLDERTEHLFVKLLIEDPETYVAYEKWLKPDYFKSEGVKVIIRAMNEFYEERQFPATYGSIQYHIERKVMAEFQMQEAQFSFKEIRDNLSLDGTLGLRECGLEYIKKKAIKGICDKMMNDFNTKEYSEEKVNEMVGEMLDINKSSNKECRILNGRDMLNMLSTVEPDSRIKLGIDELDSHIGGLPKRSVNLVVAPTGVGKTTFLSICAINAAMQGYKVAHFYFEDTSADITSKYFATVFNQDSKKFVNNVSLLKSLLDKDTDFNNAIYNNIRQVKMRVGVSSVDDIKKKIWEMMNCGFTPDFVVLDYMGCLQLSSNKVMALEKEWQLLERETKKLENMANEMNICILTAQQTNRDGCKEDTANNRIGNVQGSFRMLQPCSYVFYLTKVNDASDYNKANLYLDKSRGCPKKGWEGIYFNNGTCQINLSGAMVVNEPLPFEDSEEDYAGVKVYKSI